MNCLILAASSKKVMHSGGASDGASDLFPNIPATSGAATFTPALTWTPEPGVDGYLIYLDPDSQTFPDPALYSARYKAAGQATNTLDITGIAAGTWRLRIAPYIGSTVLEMSHEIERTAA